MALEFQGAGGAPTARYLYTKAVDQVVARDDGQGHVFWLLGDHLNTVRDVLDNSGNLLDHIQYDSFGNLLAQTNPAVVGRYLFTGREFDAETGLYYYRARSYDAALGRFLSEDPIANVNLYRYANNNPLSVTDPTGQFSLFDGLATLVGAAVGAVVGAVAGAGVGGVAGAGFGAFIGYEVANWFDHATAGGNESSRLVALLLPDGDHSAVQVHVGGQRPFHHNPSRGAYQNPDTKLVSKPLFFRKFTTSKRLLQPLIINHVAFLT